MCGFTGFWDTNSNLSKNELLSYVKRMSDQITERGPDSYGAWGDETLGIAFGHRRLSIIDLSKTGYQPMTSSSKRFVISYNGEIYNTFELRKELQEINRDLSFRGNSDTEVILEAFETWGIEVGCKRLIGMFALSLWDKEHKKLYLVRDRLGIKPLYWGYSQGVLFFGSQPKSFISHPKWLSQIEPKALTTYFRFSYIPAPLSIFKGIQKLTPGTILSFDNKGQQKQINYWTFDKVALNGVSSRYLKEKQLEELLTNELEMLLKDSVKRHMVTDVPLGAFLSGGIDSSTVVALMQSQSSQAIKTFSIGYYENSYDESQYASKIAKYLGTDHYELYLDDTLAKEIIPNIPNWYDEPFGDPSQIPTFLVSKLAKQHVKVSLSGDGGDELFTGYDRYFSCQTLWQKVSSLPSSLKKITAFIILRIPPVHWNKIYSLIVQEACPPYLGDRLHKLARGLSISSSEQFYRMIVSKWEFPEELLLTEEDPLYYPWNSNSLKGINEFLERMQYIDTLTYLPDDILVKLDRASMAVGLEARVPILDHRIVEFAWKLPLVMKYRQKQSKWLLRQVLYRHIPKQLIDRPKMGFDLPLDHWLRGPLREWADSLLNKDRLHLDGIINPITILKRWEEHLSGKRNWHYPLWGILMFQAWREYWKI